MKECWFRFEIVARVADNIICEAKSVGTQLNRGYRFWPSIKPSNIIIGINQGYEFDSVGND